MRIRKKPEDWFEIVQNLREEKPLTTLQASRVLGVALPTVIAWVNQGKLAAFKTPGRHRRIRKEHLSAFIELYEVDVPSRLKPFFARMETLAVGQAGGGKTVVQKVRKILLLGSSQMRLLAMEEQINSRFPGHEIIKANSPFQAGKHFSFEPPHIVCIDLSNQEDTTTPIWNALKEIAYEKDYSRTRLILFAKDAQRKGLKELESTVDASLGQAEDWPGLLNYIKGFMEGQ